jgi:3-methylcrotonyl-CoA carboxylase alpha subunit
LRIADEARLPLTQAQVRCTGHAFEARLCAEDPANGFLPASGRVELARFPGAPLRVEQGVDSGDDVSPFYDSMFAKLIAHGDTRAQALARLQAGLRDTAVLGPPTNRQLLQELLALPQTRDSSFHTRLVDERFGGGMGIDEPRVEHLRAAALLWLEHRRRATGPELGCWSQWQNFTGWRLSAGAARPDAVAVLRLQAGAREWAVNFGPLDAQGRMEIAIDGVTRRAGLASLGEHRYLLYDGDATLELALWTDGRRVQVAGADATQDIECQPGIGGVARSAAASADLVAPMLGKVVAIEAAAGDAVVAGQTVIVLESMKMELHVSAPFGAALQSVNCALGDMVERGAVLARLEAEPA